MEKYTKQDWSEMSTRDQTKSFIDYVNKAYYESYLDESERYERINFWSHMSIVIIGFLVTILIGLTKILPEWNEFQPLEIIIFILPSVSSVIVLYVSQRGYRQKEQIRETARIECKKLVNEARIRFSICKDQSDYLILYNWLNEEVRRLQLQQAESYFGSHENTNK
ncbi:MAG: hypothetical protein IPL53_12675 [Ignavibacteria bacterium]|nr:hypothetical protein [Ignavibacteria bacterium]